MEEATLPTDDVSSGMASVPQRSLSAKQPFAGPLKKRQRL
jgi:hypothetical protein